MIRNGLEWQRVDHIGKEVKRIRLDKRAEEMKWKGKEKSRNGEEVTRLDASRDGKEQNVIELRRNGRDTKGAELNGDGTEQQRTEQR